MSGGARLVCRHFRHGPLARAFACAGWFAAAGVAPACAGEPRPAPATAPPPPPARPRPLASPPPAGESSPQAVVDSALAQVSEVRKLAAKGPVKSRVIPRDELLKRIQRDVIADLEPELIQGSTELIFALGAAGADLDYVGTILKLLGTQLAGFYDPHEKEMVLLDDLGVEGQEATLWHELVHALQDQHYALDRLVKWEPGRGDRLAAIQALAEGDATSAMLDLMLAPRGGKALDLGDRVVTQSFAVLEAMPEIASVPPLFKRSIVAPYADGVVFAHALRREGGWAAVDAAWRDPPTTSEQVLHPEKYRSREAAEPVGTPPAPAAGPATLLYRDVLGEQGLRLAFEEWVPPSTAAETAAGWGGDQVAVFATGERRAVAVRLRFDTEPDAARAFQTIARGALTPELEGRPVGQQALAIPREKAAKASSLGRICQERRARGPFAAVRAGRDVAIALGPYRRSTVTLSDATCATALQWADAIVRAR